MCCKFRFICFVSDVMSRTSVKMYVELKLALTFLKFLNNLLSSILFNYIISKESRISWKIRAEAFNCVISAEYFLENYYIAMPKMYKSISDQKEDWTLSLGLADTRYSFFFVKCQIDASIQ